MLSEGKPVNMWDIVLVLLFQDIQESCAFMYKVNSRIMSDFFRIEFALIY